MNDDSGPAFPCQIERDDGSAFVHYGLTKRQLLAALIMAGDGSPLDDHEDAKWAVIRADALIEELSK